MSASIRIGISTEDQAMPHQVNDDTRRLLCFRLFDRAQLWLADAPDTTLPAVLDAAKIWPQKIEHDGSEFLVIEKTVLRNWERPMSGAELVKCLSENPLEPLRLDERAEGGLRSAAPVGENK